MHYKYPKTLHLPFSKSLINDDRKINDEYCFNNKTVEISVKLDGESSSLYQDGMHARSLSSAHHPSRSFMKGFHAVLKPLIPQNWRFCFENMYARHSIPYNDLESFAYLLNIWNERNYCLSLKDTLTWVQQVGLTKVETIEILKIQGNDFSRLEEIYLQIISEGQEGIVVRNIEAFPYNEFQNNVAKAVRPDHIQTDSHWTADWVPNKLKSVRS